MIFQDSLADLGWYPEQVALKQSARACDRYSNFKRARKLQTQGNLAPMFRATPDSARNFESVLGIRS